LVGLTIGSVFTLAVTTIVHLAAFGFSINPLLDAASITISLGWIGGVALLGCLLPAWWINRLNLAQLLHFE
jgi:ABC-type antimicrobial peptide transport system permease subunit